MKVPQLANPIPIRDHLIRERGWTLVRIFDTNEHEPQKDVCLVRSTDGTDLVLRVGERRPPNVFPNGYRGDHIVVPRLIESSANPIFEAEEFLPGTLLSDLDPTPTGHAIVRPNLLTPLIAGAWEVLDAFAAQPLESRWSKTEKLDTHLANARTLLTDGEQQRIDAILTATTDFWQPTHPAKWKYALDNIIRMPDGRLGLIDLARVGRYPWGYDFGWIVWPRWFHLPIAVLQEPGGHLATLERFVDEIIAHAPTAARSDDAALRRRIHLVLLERIIGAFHDVAASVVHTHRPLANYDRRMAFIEFLHAVLTWTLNRCER